MTQAPIPYKQGTGSILERMKQHLHIYFLVTATERASKKMSKKHALKPLVLDVELNYKKWHRLTSDRQLSLIYNQAKKLKYITEEKPKDTTSLSLPEVNLTDKGLRLLDTYPLIPIPTGLLQLWWDEDKLAVKLLILIVISTATYFGTATAVTIFKMLT